MQRFTQEELVQYLYNETSTEKTAAIKAALETNRDLKEKFEIISSGIRKHYAETSEKSSRFYFTVC
jgi:hypothetical protein